MVGQAVLSPWAKSVRDEHCELSNWLPLLQHCDDAEAVAGKLLDEWVPGQIVRFLELATAQQPLYVRALASWLSATHDVGKVSIAFAVQVEKLADRMRRSGLACPRAAATDPDRRSVAHSLVSHIAVRDWLAQKQFSRRVGASQIASIVGSHHGISPEFPHLVAAEGKPHLVGQREWSWARSELLHRATERAGGEEFLRVMQSAPLELPAQVLLAAIVIVADWIASNVDLFPLEPAGTVDRDPAAPDDDVTRERAKAAWSLLDFPRGWAPTSVGEDLDGQFVRRFPHVRRARKFQHAVVKVARAQRGSGLLIVEAPMGAGKTEAAYVAAEVLAAESGAGGCVIALPTQATTDAMFGRTLDWLRALPRQDGARWAVTLAHGKASLNDVYTGLLRHGRFRSIQDSDALSGNGSEVLAAHEWLQGRKEALLAPFVVCTIDQVLAAALKSRHVMLRHLGLAGKVVIIDEVHAYDVYMSQYLNRALHWLGAYGVPVVLLSATLPAARRVELLAAYQSGSGEEPVDLRAGYPLVTGSRTGSVVVPMEGDGAEVHVDRLADGMDTLIAYLREHLRDGGCVAVVRNTVTRVQQTAEALSAVFGVDRVTVAHGRFLACDRARLDGGLVRRFGKPAPGNERDGVRIVVASQVVEQSLDVDFDLLVTDLAPMDLVLQRLGRLHRHDRDRPNALRLPRCAVTGVEDWSATPVRAIPVARKVYDEHLLLRCAALLHERHAITLPQDISPLVQLAYSDSTVGPESWQPTMRGAAEESARVRARRVAKASTFLLGEATTPGASMVDWLRAGVDDADGPDGVAQVRDGAESLEVLVLQRDRDGGLLTPEWIAQGAGLSVPMHDVVPYWLAKIVASCALRLPYAMSHEGVLHAVIEALERENKIPGFQQTPLLKNQLVLVLDTDRTAIVPAKDRSFHLIYDTWRGLICERC